MDAIVAIIADGTKLLPIGTFTPKEIHYINEAAFIHLHIQQQQG